MFAFDFDNEVDLMSFLGVCQEQRWTSLCSDGTIVMLPSITATRHAKRYLSFTLRLVLILRFM